jgi:hypothetical protein
MFYITLELFSMVMFHLDVHDMLSLEITSCIHFSLNIEYLLIKQCQDM